MMMFQTKMLSIYQMLTLLSKPNLKKYKQPKQWSIVAPFNDSNNILTLNLIIRMHEVIKLYDDLIDGMCYNDTTPYSVDTLYRHNGDDIVDHAVQMSKSTTEMTVAIPLFYLHQNHTITIE